MRFPRTLFWKDGARSGAENIVEVDDPRQTCVIANAGMFMSDARATELGVMEYLYGGGGAEPRAQARGASPAEPADAKSLSEASAKEARELRQTQKAHEALWPMSVEERAYVENAPVAGHQVTEAERATAGQMGAEFTGPTPQEITQAGGDYHQASDKAAQAQGASGETPKPEEPKAPEATPSTPRQGQSQSRSS